MVDEKVVVCNFMVITLEGDLTYEEVLDVLCKKEEYINHLIDELNSYKDKLKDVKTVYIGGGTPNSLNLSISSRDSGSDKKSKRLFAIISPNPSIATKSSTVAERIESIF